MLPNGARPDLLVTGKTGSFYVEALTIMSSLAAAESGGALKAEIQEAINTIEDPEFWLSISYVQTGHSAPPKRARPPGGLWSTPGGATQPWHFRVARVAPHHAAQLQPVQKTYLTWVVRTR
jgi:hypothetical protein